MTVINTNYLALVSQNNLRTSKSALGSAIERLSSGLRINNSKDDAAGMAIANRMTAQIRGMTQAARNANDGISLAQTAEGNLKEINGNLQRIRELAVQAANDSNSDSDRGAINTEIKQRMEEIDRIAKSAEFNNTHLLDETKGRKIQFQIGANTNESQDVISIDDKTLINATLKGLGLGLDATGGAVQIDAAGTKITAADGKEIGFAKEKFDFSKAVDLMDKEGTEAKKIGTIDKDGKITDVDGKVLGELTKPNPKSAIDTNNTVYDKDGNVLGTVSDEVKAGAAGDVKNAEGEVVAKIDADGKIKGKADDGQFTEDKGTITGFGAAYKPVSAPKSAKTTGIDAGTTAESARKLITAIDKAMTTVDTGRANLGAIQNRFESTINNLNNTINNLSASRSRIEDADYAVEVSNMTRAQILQQAGTSVLAQANQVPQTVLSLLR